MNDPDRAAQGGDFQTGLPRLEADERLQNEAPAVGPEDRLSGIDPARIDVRRKLGPRGKLLLALLPLALAVGSWFLGGGTVWMLTSVLAAGSLLVVAIRYLPSIDFLGLRHYLTFGYLVLCWAAWAAVGYFLPLTTVTVKPALGSSWEKEPDCPMRITHGRQAQVEHDHPGEHTIAFRGRFDPRSLKIETRTPAGWIERSFTSYTSFVVLEEVPAARLYIDNRKHAAVDLGCGQLRFPIAAGSRQRLRLAAPPAGSRCPLTMDGKEVGVLTGEEDVLVDTLGTRSYRLRRLVYGGILDMLAGPAAGPFPRTELFRGRHVHKLGVAVDYFLEDAPKEIKVPTWSGLPAGQQTRYELLEVQP